MKMEVLVKFCDGVEASGKRVNYVRWRELQPFIGDSRLMGLCLVMGQ
jgi:hypothetical protein